MNYDDIEILFAEDSMDDALLTIRALTKSGFTNKLLHVKDGAEALDFIYCRGIYADRNPKTHPKLFLLDLKMPKISGMQVLEKIKSDPDFKSIPAVILTSSQEDPDIAKCYDLGANSYIVKPVDSNNFFNAIKEMGMYWMILSQPSL
ncbi:response regulator receiver domain-containing protein [Flavobacterium sp. 90]|jgi:CheY-like chemotaxis protein|uniref:response regulator n=1 Tax=unclassified Flavobacterium TaxID=196869 RepID=UPI000EB25EB9|nr:MULTISPECIES: response regulator [unclassified Flavobacterium]RKR08990.1 response regulator receiver protein [Flavobacterium sp. 81]TCK52777.1 response regulator receiver domain-containing protein [Flavobacterium sp. 90]